MLNKVRKKEYLDLLENGWILYCNYFGVCNFG